MRRADRQFQSIRPPVVPARDGELITMRPAPEKAARTLVSNLDTLLVCHPEAAQVIRDVLRVALELTAMLPRPVIERFVERLIERLDDLDGDPDLEPIDEREPE